MDTLDPGGRSRRDPCKDDLPSVVRDAYLGNHYRRRIVQLVQTHPGVNQNQIAERLGCTASTVTYHLDRLEKSSQIIIVTPQENNQKRCFTPDNVHLWQSKRFRLLLGRDTPLKIARYVTRNPGVTTRQIAEELDFAVTTIQGHIRQLREAHLVQDTRLDRNIIYHARPLLVEWMESVEGEGS